MGDNAEVITWTVMVFLLGATAGDLVLSIFLFIALVQVLFFLGGLIVGATSDKVETVTLPGKWGKVFPTFAWGFDAGRYMGVK